MKQTVLGNIKSQPEVLKYTLDNQNVFVDPFVEVFKKHDIKKVFFFDQVLPTMYLRSLLTISNIS